MEGCNKMDKNKQIYVVGIGPGDAGMLTPDASEALRSSDVLVGYPLYLDLLGAEFDGKERLSTPMKQERERCMLCLEEAANGKTVSLVCSGDPGVYGLASLMLEVGKERPDITVTVIPGITAALSGAAVLGAPVNHDFCLVSLSDLLTPWEVIERRLEAAAAGDFVIVLYNPGSRHRPDHLRRAAAILLRSLPGERPCGLAENIGRSGMKAEICKLAELGEKEANMFTTVFIGNSATEVIGEKLVTKRGYPDKGSRK
jgi:precorrin-3B C17-methyltransferase